jgi:glyoxylase I family protein
MNGIHHVAMKVYDFEKTVEFYTKGLGFVKGISWGEGENRAIMIDIGEGTCLEIFAGGTKVEKEDGVFIHIAFKSKSCDEDIERAKKAGAIVTAEVQNVDILSNPIKPVRIAFCKGINGEIIEFFEER